jgi:hypothetical protein
LSGPLSPIRYRSLATTFGGMSHTVQRVVGVLVFLVVGVLSLPVVAYVFDGQGSENWIVPVQLLLMAAVGAGVTVALPALARDGATTQRRALLGVVWGLLAAVAAVALFFLLLSGFRGA